MTTKYLLSIFLCCSIFLLSCESGCTTTTPVGGSVRPIVIVNDDGSNYGIRNSTAGGTVTHPCGTLVGIGQNQ